MADSDSVVVLSTSWRLVNTINDVLNRVEQTRQDARALKFLHRQARSFLDTVDEGLLGRDTSPYTGTILSLESLLADILKASTHYVKMSAMTRLLNASQTKRTILQLERRLQFFVNTYLVQSATHNDRINLPALTRPVTPLRSGVESLVPDDVQWEIMSHGDASSMHGPRERVLNWTQEIANEPLHEVQSVGSIKSQPGIILPPPIPRDMSVDASELRKSRFYIRSGNPVIDQFNAEEDRRPHSDAQVPEPVPPMVNGQQSSSLSIPDWQSVKKCVESVLGDRNIPLFLGIFSLSKNFECVLDALEIIYYTNPLSDMPGTRVGVLTVLTKFVTDLWLTDVQISRLSNAFASEALLRAKHDVTVLWAADIFFESLQKGMQESEVTIQDPIASLGGNKNMQDLAVGLAHALAVLEDRLRRTDPVGECIRWSARKHTRDFLSFPERVEMWVLQSVLQEEFPLDMGLRYQLFYKVAKRSKDIHNFSAVRAIMSALKQLEQIHIETKVGTSELYSLTRLDYHAAEYDARKARRNHKPYLQPLEDILFQVRFSIDNVEDTHHQIHWNNYTKLLEEVDTFTTHAPLTSNQQYVFDGNPVMGFAKKCLVNVEVLDDVEIKVKDALGRYWRAQPTVGPLFEPRQTPLLPAHPDDQPLTTPSRTSRTGSTRRAFSGAYQDSVFKGSRR